MSQFFEILPDLKLSQSLAELFTNIECEKVTTSKDRRKIKLYLNSEHLINFQDIQSVAKEIENQMFKKQCQVELKISYHLSQMYTPENLLEIYGPSIDEELKQQSFVLATLFENAKKEFKDAFVLTLHVEKNDIVEIKMNELKAYLEEIFMERFHLPLTVLTEWLPAQKSKYAIYAEQALQEEVSHIINTYEQSKEEASDKLKNETKIDKMASNKEHTYKKDYTKKRLPEDKDIFYGRPFEGDEIEICHITGEIGEVIVKGKVLNVETREIRNEKTIVMFDTTDFTDTIRAKIFVKNEQLPEILDKLKKGSFIRMRAVAVMDNFEKDIALASVSGIKTISDFTTKRADHSPVKRVELHCHTTMSDMDGVTDCEMLIKNAMSFGHTAMAITDHGVVQAFPQANHVVEKNDFKVIYGMEGYLVDDMMQPVFHSKGQSLDQTYVVFDIETTGFSSVKDRIIEIGAVKIENGKIIDHFSEFINPQVPISLEIQKLTHIKDEMVENAPVIDVVLPAFIEFCKGCVLVAHNANFDTGFIKQKCRDLNILYDFTHVDTLAIARWMMPDLPNHKLDKVVAAFGCTLDEHHRAVYDAQATADVFVKMLERLKQQQITNLDELNEHTEYSVDVIKKLPTYHIILLAKNEIGRINLYRLVSLSHLTYYARRPRIPRSQLMKYREGIIVGSACEAGELFKAVLDGKSDEDIAKIVEFYDYLEIQPVGNNEFMIRDEKRSDIQNFDDLRNLNKKIVELGTKFNKPVCATCDVHFMNPEDEVFRRIIMANKNFSDADLQPPLYFRTTEEMLEEFQYLGSQKAEEVVITNTNLIANMIDKISPVRPDKCPPIIEDSDKILRSICYNKAHELYGDNLPEVVVERLERELNSIIGNGFAVMYIIAQKLVWKSVADGYLVGSRGSVGSSFVAYMAGITEVNSLQAHYLCMNCHYVDFDSDYVRSFSGRSGCDMEDKLCPVCGEPLVKEGHDIPFETFLGFKGNKEPDIDLNFSGDYQSKAHAYTEVIFGKGKTFRAGTVGTLADKTAFGYAKHYFEDRDEHKRSCEIVRLAQGCVGVRRTTGQHPGGIIVVPHGEEIFSFTPVQHPANDQTTKIITTHFDYHSIDHNLLKLDILGHDDPTMIRMLEDITGVDATKIRLDDPDVLSLFRGLDALHIKPEDIGGIDLGSLGIPEFGTDFVMQMLRDTKPKAFSDLVRISGLSHGTDVWLNNAQTLIQQGKAEISTAICTRDDIMIYLINKGVESEQSFKIMESVRKGKGLTPDNEKVMTEHGVPDWYLWSCNKIKYMFPKAHAVAYVMMGIRIAWFKIHRPLAYYAAFFTIRATAFDYALMCQGKAAIDRHIANYKANPDLSKKDQDTLRDMKIVQEFYARGYEFVKIDLYQSDAIKFQIVDGKLLPPFSVIEGMGGIAAEALAVAAKGEPFLSKDDIKQRAKVSSSVLDIMGELGLLGDLPETNQLSIFDYFK